MWNNKGQASQLRRASWWLLPKSLQVSVHACSATAYYSDMSADILLDPIGMHPSMHRAVDGKLSCHSMEECRFLTEIKTLHKTEGRHGQVQEQENSPWLRQGTHLPWPSLSPPDFPAGGLAIAPTVPWIFQPTNCWSDCRKSVRDQSAPVGASAPRLGVPSLTSRLLWRKAVLFFLSPFLPFSLSPSSMAI